MSLEIGEKVYFTLNGNARKEEDVVWYEAHFSGIAYLGPAREPANRVKITVISHPEAGWHKVGEEILLGNKRSPFDNPIRLIRGEGELDFCTDPDTNLWTDNFSNEPFMLEQVYQIARELEKKG